MKIMSMTYMTARILYDFVQVDLKYVVELSFSFSSFS